MKALTATSDGTLYAGGRFGNLEDIPAADNVAYLPLAGRGTPWAPAPAPAAVRWTPSYVR